MPGGSGIFYKGGGEVNKTIGVRCGGGDTSFYKTSHIVKHKMVCNLKNIYYTDSRV